MNSWTGTAYPNPTIFDQCCSGGPGVAMNTDYNTLRFSYGMSTATQSIAINQALAAAGSGLKVVGFNYSWQIMNDLSNSGGTRGTLTGEVSLTGADNSVLKTYNYNYSNLDTGNAFQLITGTETFGPQYDASALKNLTVSFTGKDQNWWAGYYGPRVRDPNISLNYMVDPCVGNPAYSPTCPGFSSVKVSSNLGQAYAIQTALAHSGTGLIVHGFNYGFNWNTGETCTFELIFCFAWGPSGLGVNAVVTNSNGTVIASKGYDLTSQNSSGSVTGQIRFPTSLNQLTLGNFAITSGGGDGSYISNVWSSMVYSPDLCDKNPLYSPSCNKFVSTILANQKAAQQSLTSSSTDSTGTSTNPAVKSMTSYTSSTAMADPTKNEVTNTNVGGVQVTTTGEITPVVNVPKFVRGANEAGELVKEKEKPKVIVKPPVIAVPVAPAQRRVVDTTQDAFRFDTQDIAAQIVEQQAAVSIVATSPQEIVQQQARATATSTASSRRVIMDSYDASGEGNETSAASKSSGQGLVALNRGQGLQANEVQLQQRQAIMSATNPLNSYLTMIPSENQPDQKATVKKDVQNNELASGVDLSKMAIQPVGFNDYMNLALTDAAFYGPREVYQNQRVVDNARAQRLLQGASDRMHQDMVNSQYRMGQ